MHALMFRKWKNRVKGRDWYDLEWYVKNNIPLNLNQFNSRAIESGDLLQPIISKDEFFQIIQTKITSLNFETIKDDVIRFIKDPRELEIWSSEYFLLLVKRIKIELTN